MYTIGELSKHTGITVRTLDYYDEIGLVKPSSKTSGGHRLYDEEDVLRLERVLALKYMGFKLDKIKEIIKNFTGTWMQSFEQQLEMVRREQERLKMIEHSLIGVSHYLEVQGEINWSIIFSTIQLYQQNPEEIFQPYNDYLSKDEVRKIIDMSEQMTEEDIKGWVKIISDIKENLEVNPESEVGQELVGRWLSHAEKMFGNDEELLGSLWDSLQNLKEGSAFYPMDKDVIDFVQRAAAVKFAKNES